MSTLARSLPLPPPNPSRFSRWALVRAWLPTFLWIGVIAFESTSVFTSDHTQSWIHAVMNFIVGPRLAAYAPVLNEYGRKVGHFTGYGILSLLSFFGWTELLRYRQQVHLASLGRIVEVARRWHLRAAALAVLVTFCVASLDEFHQTFIPGRTGQFRDVLLDTMGGIFAQILILLFWKSGTGKQLTTGTVLESAGAGTRD